MKKKKLKNLIIDDYKKQCPADQPKGWNGFAESMEKQGFVGNGILMSLGKNNVKAVTHITMNITDSNNKDTLKKNVKNLIFSILFNPIVIVFIIIGFIFFILLLFHLCCFSKCCRRGFSFCGYGDSLSDNNVEKIPKKVFIIFFFFIIISIIVLVFSILSVAFATVTRKGVSSLECDISRFLYEFEVGDVLTSNENSANRSVTTWFTGNKNNDSTSPIWIGYENIIPLKSNILQLVNPRGGTINKLFMNHSDTFKKVSKTGRDSLVNNLKNMQKASEETEKNVASYGHASVALNTSLQAYPDIIKEFEEKYDTSISQVEEAIQQNVGENSPVLNDAYNSIKDFDVEKYDKVVVETIKKIKENVNDNKDIVYSIVDYLLLAEFVWSVIYLIPVIIFSGILIYLYCYSKKHSENEIFRPNKCLRCCAGCNWILFALLGSFGFILCGILLLLGIVGGIPCYIARVNILQDGVIPVNADVEFAGKCLQRGSTLSLIPDEIKEQVHNFTNFEVEEELNKYTEFCNKFSNYTNSVKDFQNNSWVYLPNESNEYIKNLTVEEAAFARLTGIQSMQAKVKVDPDKVTSVTGISDVSAEDKIIFGLNDLLNRINNIEMQTLNKESLCIEYQDNYNECISNQDKIIVDDNSILNKVKSGSSNDLSTLYNKIKTKNTIQGEDWFNLVNLLIQKMNLRKKQIYVVPIISEQKNLSTQKTTWDLFSPYDTSNLSAGLYNDAIKKFISLADSTCIKTQGTIKDTIKSVDNLKQNLNSDVDRLIDGPSCQFLWKHLDLFTYNGCVETISPIPLIAVFWIVLNFMCIAGFILAFMIWHYLHNKYLEAERALKKETNTVEFKDEESAVVLNKESFIAVDEGFYAS